jgi:hypothetical protein
VTHPHITTPLPGPPPGIEPTPEEAVAAAVASCPDVVELSGGPYGEVATYLAGRRIAGVRMLHDSIEIHVIARLGTPLPSVAEQVRSACSPFAGGRPVDVTIDDVATDPGDEGPPDSRDSVPRARSTPHPAP